jgi:hypothetical protein
MDGERWLGNSENKEVHDLERETPECMIAKIMEARHEIAFRVYQDAKDQGYKNCPHCVDENAAATCKI